MIGQVLESWGLTAHKGAILMFLATLFLLGMQVCVKSLGHLPSSEVVVFRSILTAVFTLYLIRQQHVSFLGNNRGLLVLRAMVGTIGLVLGYYALQELPLATSVTIMHISPLISAIAGIFVLGERMRSLQWIGFALALGGVAVIKGFDPRVETLPFVALCVGTTAAGFAYNFIRKLRHTDHPLTIILYLSVFGVVAGGLLTGTGWKMPQGVDWLLILAMGLCTQLYQVTITGALHSDRIAKVMPIKYSGVVLAALAGFVFFNEPITWIILTGMAFIVAGILINLKVKQTK